MALPHAPRFHHHFNFQNYAQQYNRSSVALACGLPYILGAGLLREPFGRVHFDSIRRLLYRFVLGFLGKSVLASATTAALLGYLVFSSTGLMSGWIISLFHPKSVWLPACVSLLLTGTLLAGTTWIRYKYVGISGLETILPLPATTGRTDADELSRALKTEYQLVEPPCAALFKR